jgi:eukaryotic-like serine/threonine-protein kinase
LAYNGPVFTAGAIVDGRYEIVGLLGAGGMGEIYRARRVLLGDEVAIKVMRAVADADEMLERFMRESRACAQLRHPHIVSVLDFNVGAEGRPFLVMEYLNGASVKDELARVGRFPLPFVTRLMAELGGALQLAHDRGIIHRDLKPANIVSHRYGTGETVYKVIDFGIVTMRAAADETRLTGGSQFLGTVTYASPEQLRGGEVDARSDVYALGAVTFELLTGQPPFADPDPLVVVSHHLTADPPRPTSLAPDLPPWIDEVVARALAKSPEDRWPRVVDFARALAGTDAEDCATASAPPAVPSGMVGKYELGDRLGRGRFGSEIYAATHRALNHPVAVRTLRRGAVHNWDAARGRLLREAQALQVAHPSIIQVRDFGEEPDLVYVVTELIEGSSLRELLARGGLIPWPRLERLLRQFLSAAAALHRRGGLLCGLSPEIMRMTRDDDGERLMISSSGICQVQDLLGTLSEQTLRGAGAVDSEVHYVSPEIFMGRAPDARADVYTIGVLMYEMATGRWPFDAATMHGLLGAALTTTPRHPRELQPEIPAHVAEAILQCLRPDPAARCGTVGEIVTALWPA